MRAARYAVAMSLDGFIAAPDGSVDWLLEDPAIDFAELIAPYDTLVMGRGTWEVAQKLGGGFMGMTPYVCSTTLGPDDCPGCVVTADGVATVAELKRGEGKDLWIFGGAVLFRALAEAGLVDGVDLMVMPILLGEGIPMIVPGPSRLTLKLTLTHSYPSGIVRLCYDVAAEAG